MGDGSEVVEDGPRRLGHPQAPVFRADAARLEVVRLRPVATRSSRPSDVYNTVRKVAHGEGKAEGVIMRLL